MNEISTWIYMLKVTTSGLPIQLQVAKSEIDLNK